MALAERREATVLTCMLAAVSLDGMFEGSPR